MHHHLRRPLFVNLSKSHATKLKLVDCWYVLLPRQEVTSRGVQTKVKSCKSELEKERERERERKGKGEGKALTLLFFVFLFFFLLVYLLLIC